MFVGKSRRRVVKVRAVSQETKRNKRRQKSLDTKFYASTPD